MEAKQKVLEVLAVETSETNWRSQPWKIETSAGGKNSGHMAPEVGESLACMRYREKASGAPAQWGGGAI